MQTQNIKEYELVRDEMLTVKDCITKYIGFVLGGAGAAVFLLVRGGDKFQLSSFEISLMSLSFSIIINFVMLILIYKFKSHNRMAGYCKLLSHEKFDSKINKMDRHFIVWELLVDKLRFSYEKTELVDKYLDEMNKIDNPSVEKVNLNIMIRGYIGEKKGIFTKGVKIIWSSLKHGKSEARSWAFPPLVSAMFLALSTGFFLLGIIIWIPVSMGEIKLIFLQFIFLIPLSIVAIGVHFYFWWRFIQKLFLLMEGSLTVNAYFLKFIPVRAHFLIMSGITPRYLHIGKLLEDLIQQTQSKKDSTASVAPPPSSRDTGGPQLT